MKVLLTGLGSIGRRHLGLLRERDDVDEIIAYRTSVTGDIEGVEEFGNLDTALATAPDVAFVTNPTHVHCETALSCAEAGCDLFVEKPLSHSLERLDELCRVVDVRDLVTMVGCQLRFTPVLRSIREVLSAEKYGPALSFEAYSGSYLPDWRPNKDYRESYSADPERGGGAVLDLIHELDYSHWLFGPFDEICGRLGSESSLEIETEDVAVMTVEGHGVVGTIHVDYCRPVPRRTLEIVCEDGVLTADLIEQTVSVETSSEIRVENFDYTRDDAFRAQLDSFFEAVERRERTCNDIRVGKNVLNLALNAKSSHR